MTVRDDLQPTPECIALERLDGPLSPAERAHVEACPRCEAELAVWHAMNDRGAADAAEDEDAAWIVARLRDRFAHGPAKPASLRAEALRRFRPVLAMAAAAALALAVGYLAMDPHPSPSPGSTEGPIYRSLSLKVVAPVGDVAVAPRELVWGAVPSAVVYDVHVLEIDRTTLWQTSSPAPRVALPRAVIAQLVPGKTVLWEVTARSAAGASLATSGTQRFRVSLARPRER